MDNKTYNQIISDSKKHIAKEAKANDWEWFFNIHQKEMVKCAVKLLRYYKADRKIVIISAWLHDISRYSVREKTKHMAHHKIHHIESAKFSRKFLSKYDINKKEKNKIYECIIRHRNTAPYKARTIEEKIIAVADTLSHYTGVFYFLHFKFHPESSIEFMAKNNLEKLKRDWRDLSLLPKAKKMVRKEYSVLRVMYENYFKKYE